MAVNSVTVVSNNGITESVVDDGSGNLTITLGLGDVAPTGNEFIALGKTLVVGNGSGIAAGVNAASQVIGTGGEAHSIMNWNGSYPTRVSVNSAGSTVGTHGALSSGNELFQEDSYGDDGTNYTRAISIRDYVDGTVSNGIVPGRREIWTGNSSGALTKAVVIDSSQNVTVTNDVISKRVKTNISPATNAQFDSSASASFQITTGSNASVTPSSGSASYLIFVEESQTTGCATLYIANGGGVAWAGFQTNGNNWVASTSTPAAGKFSIAWDNTSGTYKIYNNEGSTCTFHVSLIRNN